MSKYGDINNSNSITNEDVAHMVELITGQLDSSFYDMDIDENPNSNLNNRINDFSKLNVHRKIAFSGPAAHELLKLNHIASGNLPEEEYNDADYDFSVSSKGANVDMHNNDFIASFPTTIDYRSWNDNDQDEAKECGWIKLYTKDGQYKQHKNLLPPTEFLKTKDFVHSDYGLRSIAKSDKFVAVSSYLYGDSDKQEGLVNIYEKLSSGNFVFRHLLKVEDTTRAPTVEILDDQLFVGNPTQPPGSVRIYSLSELSKNQNFYGYNSTEPTELLLETDLDVTQSSTPSFFGHTIKAYSDGTNKLLIIGAPHFSVFRNDATTSGDFEIGAVYVYRYDTQQSKWTFINRILLPAWEDIPFEEGYGFEKLAMKFGFSFDFIFRSHGSQDNIGILLIGAPHFYHVTPPTKRTGRVYAYRVYNADGYGFELENIIECPENELSVQFDDVGLFEFGRSIVLDNQDNAWIASNPQQGSTVSRFGVDGLDTNSQNWIHEESVKISEDRDGGVLTTNRDDVVFGSANNIKVFQDQGASITALKNTDKLNEDIIEEQSENNTDEELSVPYLNKQFPKEWGNAPTESSHYLVPLPFGYGVGTTQLAGWIEENSTGDVRTNKYLKSVVDSEVTSETKNYSELMEIGNPTIRITPWSSTIGNTIDIYSPHGHLIAEYGNPLIYKSSTVCTLVLIAKTPNNMMASWKINDTFIDGSDRIELLIRGENMDVSVDFKRNVKANKDHIRCVECREGKIIVSDKKV